MDELLPLPDLDDLVDLRMDGRASPFELLHDMDDNKATGGLHMPHEPHRLGLLRSRDVLQVSLSCGSFEGNQQEDSMVWGSIHGEGEMPHEPQHGTQGAREATTSKPRAQPYGLVQPLAPVHTSAAAPGPITSFAAAQLFQSDFTDSPPAGSRLQTRAATRGPSALGPPQPPQPPPPSDNGVPLRGTKALQSHLGPGSRSRMGARSSSSSRPRAPRSRARPQGSSFDIPLHIPPLLMPQPAPAAAGDADSNSHQSSGEFCYICHQFYSDCNISLEQPGGEMLLCDGCDKGWHQFCLTPPVLRIPSEHEPWFCPVCVATKAQAQLAGAHATSLPPAPAPAPAPVPVTATAAGAGAASAGDAQAQPAAGVPSAQAPAVPEHSEGMADVAPEPEPLGSGEPLRSGEPLASGEPLKSGSHKRSGSQQQASQPDRKRTHSSSQGAVTGLHRASGDSAGAQADMGVPSGQQLLAARGSGDTTSSNVSAAVKAEVVGDSVVEESPATAATAAGAGATNTAPKPGRRNKGDGGNNVRGALRRRALAAPTPAPAAKALRSPTTPSKATPAAATKRTAAAERVTTSAGLRTTQQALPSLVRPERLRKYGAVGKQALRLTNFVGRTFFGLGAHKMSCEVRRGMIELDGKLLPEVYEGAKVVLDNPNSSPRLINFGGRHTIGLNYDCGIRREADGTIVFLLATKEPNTDQWPGETAAALKAVGGAPAAPAAQQGRSPKDGAGAAARRPRKRSRPDHAAPPSTQPPGPPSPAAVAAAAAAVAAAAAAGLVRPPHPRRLVTERGRKPWVTREVFDALWPAAGGAGVDTELDLIVDGVTAGLRRAAKLKAGEAGRVYVTGVTWQEAEQLWDGGMQRLGPTLVALYATRTPPPGAARVDSAAGAGEMGGRGATGERPPKRPRRGPGGAAAGAPGAQQQQRAQAPRVRAGASARGAVAAGAGAGRAPPSGVPGAAGSSAPAVEQKSRQAPQPDGIHASGEHGAEAGSAGVTMSQVTLSHMEKGGALLLEIGQALELTGTQRMAAVRAVYALSKDQVKLGLLLCMGLPHIKAEVDAGRKEEARSALKELLPEVGL